jgi:hypothetical protein
MQKKMKKKINAVVIKTRDAAAKQAICLREVVVAVKMMQNLKTIPSAVEELLLEKTAVKVNKYLNFLSNLKKQ